MKFTRDAPRNREVNRMVSHLPGVRKAVGSVTDRVESRARADLASRRVTGEHTIDSDKSGVDHYVILRGPGALSLEVGHHNARSGEFVEGARILRNALGA